MVKAPLLNLTGLSKYGVWKDDKKWNVTEYSKDRNITNKWVNGKKQP